jgi:hypothetical protein
LRKLDFQNLKITTIVGVRPPLFCNGPRFGLLPLTIPGQFWLSKNKLPEPSVAIEVPLTTHSFALNPAPLFATTPL